MRTDLRICAFAQFRTRVGSGGDFLLWLLRIRLVGVWSDMTGFETSRTLGVFEARFPTPLANRAGVLHRAGESAGCVWFRTSSDRRFPSPADWVALTLAALERGCPTGLPLDLDVSPFTLRLSSWLGRYLVVRCGPAARSPMRLGGRQLPGQWRQRWPPTRSPSCGALPTGWCVPMVCSPGSSATQLLLGRGGVVLPGSAAARCWAVLGDRSL